MLVDAKELNMAANIPEETNIPTMEKPIVEPEFVITRTFKAPIESLWKAWTDPENLKQWWGPRGFAVPVREMDVRPGGTFRIVMRSSDGVNYPLKGIYRKVVQPELLVYTENWEEHPTDWQNILIENGDGNEAQGALTTVTFKEQKGRTIMSIKTLFESFAMRNAMLKIGMKEGWMESLDRLDEFLEKA